MTPDIPTLREKLARATPGPWEHDREWNDDAEYGSGPNTGRGYDDFLILGADGSTLFGSENSTAKSIEVEYDEDSGTAWDHVALRNAALIVAAVNSLPALLDQLEAAQARVAALEAGLARILAVRVEGWENIWAGSGRCHCVEVEVSRPGERIYVRWQA